MFNTKTAILLFISLAITNVYGVNFNSQFNRRNGKTINSFCLLSERCTGSEFTQLFILRNTQKIKLKDLYCRHWYPWSKELVNGEKNGSKVQDIDYGQLKDRLFVVLVRNVYDWTRSLYNNGFGVPNHILESPFCDFLHMKYMYRSKKWHAEYDGFNPYKGKCFRNILELRRYKLLNYLTIARSLGNVIVARYEDILENKKEFLEYLSDSYGIKVSEAFDPISTFRGKGKKQFKKPTYKAFSQEEKETLEKLVDWDVEALFGYEK